jgi:hypothetical protein
MKENRQTYTHSAQTYGVHFIQIHTYTYTHAGTNMLPDTHTHTHTHTHVQNARRVTHKKMANWRDKCTYDAKEQKARGALHCVNCQ